MQFLNFNEKEESTVINSLTMLRHSPLKTYLCTPLLSVLTLMVHAIRLYWSAQLRAYYLYDKVRSLDRADHILVTGKDGNIEIVSIQDMTDIV